MLSCSCTLTNSKTTSSSCTPFGWQTLPLHCEWRAQHGASLPCTGLSTRGWPWVSSPRVVVLICSVRALLKLDVTQRPRNNGGSVWPDLEGRQGFQRQGWGPSRRGQARPRRRVAGTCTRAPHIAANTGAGSALIAHHTAPARSRRSSAVVRLGEASLHSPGWVGADAHRAQTATPLAPASASAPAFAFCRRAPRNLCLFASRTFAAQVPRRTRTRARARTRRLKRTRGKSSEATTAPPALCMGLVQGAARKRRQWPQSCS